MCVTEGNFTQICQEHADEMVAAFRDKYPGLIEKFGPGGDRCGHCIEFDITDEFDRAAANEWAAIRWML